MSLIDQLAAIVGTAHVSTDPDVLDGRSVTTPVATAAAQACWCGPVHQFIR